MFNKNVFPLLIVHLITITLALTIAQAVYGLDLNEGDNCFHNGTQQDGICTKSSQCEKQCAIEEIKPEQCRARVRGKAPIICCPKARPTKSISGEKCLEYKELACNRYYISTAINDPPMVTKISNCARNTLPVILGGEEAQKREFPHMALIRWENDENTVCGGTLISDQFVLTAAHCLEGRTGIPTHVRLGEHDRSNSTESEHIDIKVDRVFTHDDYQAKYSYEDISLVKLERPVSFTEAIRPACLPDEPITFDIVNATATGWGYGKQRQSSDVLMKVDLKLFDDSKCSDYIKPDRRRPLGYVKKTQLCAGSETHVNNTCGGDSGGPLQIMHKYHYCTYTIIGVTSFGKDCLNSVDESIGAYTRVYPYLTWIESIVWPQQNEGK